jgi:hypothetical protein
MNNEMKKWFLDCVEELVLQGMPDGRTTYNDTDYYISVSDNWDPEQDEDDLNAAFFSDNINFMLYVDEYERDADGDIQRVIDGRLQEEETA